MYIYHKLAIKFIVCYTGRGGSGVNVGAATFSELRNFQFLRQQILLRSTCSQTESMV